MTENHRIRLLTACVFCTVFSEAANQELMDGDPTKREEATHNLAAALLALEPEMEALDGDSH